MALLHFDARTVAPDQGTPEPIPAGWYKVVMDSSEMVPTKDGVGMRLTLVFKIIDGQYTNRKIFEGLNLKNASPVAQEIAYKQLSAICHATGVLVAEDSAQLHNIPLQIKVKLKAATGAYDAKNEVAGYKHINEVVSNTPAVAPNPFAPPPAIPAAIMPPPQTAWTPPAAPAPAPVVQQWTPPAAPQPWAPAPQAAPPAPQAAWTPPAPVAPPAPAAAPAPAPAWAAAPAPVAPQAAPLGPPPGYVAPQAAPVAPVAPVAPQAAPAGVQPPWMTAPVA
jgi:hypothetical protein